MKRKGLKFAINNLKEKSEKISGQYTSDQHQLWKC